MVDNITDMAGHGTIIRSRLYDGRAADEAEK